MLESPVRPVRWLPEPSARGQALLQGRPLLAIEAATLLVMAVVVATRLWQDYPWLGFAIVGVTAVAWLPELWVVRARRWWFVYVAGIFVYTLLRSLADETTIPIRTGYVIDADSWLFGGTTPVEHLQERLFSRGNIDLLDYFAVAVHWSFFIAPHALAVALFAWRRDLFRRYTVVVVGSMYLGLLLFFLLPTVPPWMASERGALPGVYRVMDFVGGNVSTETYEQFYASLGEPNSVAAMPSIHLAITLAMFLIVRPYYPKLAAGLLAYTAVMGVALIYLGEHYFLDLAVGAMVAVVCYALSWRMARPAHEHPREVKASPR